MSRWEQFDMEKKIRQILTIQSHDPGHHFCRPFMTPYQIAINFKKDFSIEFKQINEPVGGKGTGQYHSLAQYIARELSQRILKKKIKGIEGRFLHRKYLSILKYDGGVESSNEQACDISMYRLTDLDPKAP